MLHIYCPRIRHAATYLPHIRCVLWERKLPDLGFSSALCWRTEDVRVTSQTGEAGIRQEVTALTYAGGAVLILPTDAHVDKPLLAVSSSVSSSAT